MSDRAADVALIEKVARETNGPSLRNHEIVRVCGIARLLLVACDVTQQTASAPVALPDKVTLPSECPTCAAARAKTRARVAKVRAKKGKVK